jgi:hypothetical protein
MKATHSVKNQKEILPVVGSHSIQLKSRAFADPSSQPHVVQSSQAVRPFLPIQAKLTIGEPNDKYEKEADQVAAQVVQQINAPQSTSSDNVQRQEESEEEELQMKPISTLQRDEAPEEEELQMKPISVLQRDGSPEEEEELQMKSIVQRQEAIGGGDASGDLESTINSARGGGQALDSTLQTKMGQAMGADFSRVKIHTDTTADKLNRSVQARAFTTGNDVFFKKGEYNPQSSTGQELIAHELTHVVQQNGSQIRR